METFILKYKTYSSKIKILKYKILKYNVFIRDNHSPYQGMLVKPYCLQQFYFF